MDTPAEAVLADVRAQLLRDLDDTAWELLPASLVEQAADRWLSEQLERCTALAWGETFAKHCPVPGASPADYLQRWVRVGDEWVLIGIRMRGGDIAHPFVDLVAWSRPVPLDDAFAAACDHLAVFAPGRARLRGGPAPPNGGSLSVSLDQVYVAGATADVGQGAHAVLEPITSTDEGLAFVEATYDTWTASRPWIKDRVQVVTHAQLASAQAADSAWWIHGDDERVGLIATLPGPDREWSGHLVLEEVVRPGHAGRGWAARAQRSVAALLHDRGVPVLFGTIDAMNAPSLRAATAVGRPVVGAWWWLDPEPGHLE